MQGEPPKPPAPIRVLDPIVASSNQYFSSGKIGAPMAALAIALLACSGFYSWWTRPPKQQNRVAEPAVARPSAAVRTDSTASTVQVSASTQPDDINGQDINHVVLNLSATEKTWLSITNSEGKQIFSGILQPSQTKTLSASEVAQMKVGNAGGIEVRLNGKEIGPIGGRGEVRTVVFTAPDKYEIVEPQTSDAPEDTTL